MSPLIALFRARKHSIFITIPILVLYASVAYYLSGFHAFWSLDSGARFTMIHNLADGGRLIYPHYSAADLDPSGQIHPLTFFLFHRKHDFCMMYLPLFPLLSSVAYYVFGFGGLTLLPNLCGMATILIFGRTARMLGLHSGPLGMMVLGLATPLIVYSVVFWDHSAQMMITGLVGYWMLRSVTQNALYPAVLAGVMLGLGMWVHELFLALFVAIWFSALTIRGRRCNISFGLLLGFVPMILTWGLLNLMIYGAFGGPHLGANVLQNNTYHPFSIDRILNGVQLADRSMLQLVGVSIFSSQDGVLPYHLVFASLLIIYAFAGWAGKPINVITPFLGLIIAVFALVLLLRSHDASEGLFLVTPLLVPALSVPWYIPHDQSAISTTQVFYAWLSRTCWLFIIFMLVNPMTPGADWGSRYLLLVLPLLFLLSIYALEQQYQQKSGYERGAFVWCTAGIMAISLLCQINGLLMVRRSLAYGQELNSHIQAISTPVLVTDTDMTAFLTESPAVQARFEVRTDPDAKLFAMVLRKRLYQEVTFVGNEEGEVNVEDALAASGEVFMVREQHPLWKINHASQEGKQLELIRFVVKQKG